MSQKVIIFCVAFLLLLAACAPNVGESAEGGGVSVTAVSIPTLAPITQSTKAPPIRPTAIPTLDPTIVAELIYDPVIEQPRLTESEMMTVLEGSWVWQSSTYLVVPEGDPSVETPEMTGNHVILIFGADKFVEEYRNGELISREAYNIFPDPDRSGWMLSIGEVPSWVVNKGLYYYLFAA